MKTVAVVLTVMAGLGLFMYGFAQLVGALAAIVLDVADRRRRRR